MDEVELVVKGQVDRWRIDRRNAYNIVIANGMMKNPPSVTEMFPLPYDEDIATPGMSPDEMVSFYNSVTANWN